MSAASETDAVLCLHMRIKKKFFVVCVARFGALLYVCSTGFCQLSIVLKGLDSCFIRAVHSLQGGVS